MVVDADEAASDMEGKKQRCALIKLHIVGDQLGDTLLRNKTIDAHRHLCRLSKHHISVQAPSWIFNASCIHLVLVSDVPWPRVAKGLPLLPAPRLSCGPGALFEVPRGPMAGGMAVLHVSRPRCRCTYLRERAVERESDVYDSQKRRKDFAGLDLHLLQDKKDRTAFEWTGGKR